MSASRIAPRGSNRPKRVAALAATALSAVIVLAGCSSDDTASTSTSTSTLNISAGGVFTTDNNPFSAVSPSMQGWTYMQYEPLVQANTVITTAEPIPWLASAYSWSDDFTSVTFTARDGVKWSDGEDFGTDDIAFTFNLIKDNGALNTNNLDIQNVSESGNDVTVTFPASQFVKKDKILLQFIVPEHVWKDVEDPATFGNTEPVGTGPFVFESATSTVAKLSKNPLYWQADKVMVENIIFQSFQTNDTTLNAIAAHDLDWANAFALNQREGFVDLDPEMNVAINIPKLGIDVFMINNAQAPFDSVELRRAMSLVIDRERSASLATGGILGSVKSISGLPQPVGDPFIAPDLKGKEYVVDIDAAKKELVAGGFNLDGDTLYDQDGNPVTMTLITPAGWTDFTTHLQIISEDLKQIGIEATIETPSQEAVTAAIQTGNFDGALWYSDSGGTPYDIYAGYMDGSKLQPIGTAAMTNYNRFNDPVATEALNTYATSADADARDEALYSIQRIFADQVPVIPIVSKVSWALWTNVNWVGWPTEDNVYADPNFRSSNSTLILTQLTPAK